MESYIPPARAGSGRDDHAERIKRLDSRIEKTAADLAEDRERIKAEVTANLKKSGITAALAKAAARERGEKIALLEKSAKEWRDKATNGRVNGLDREVRELYLRKAAAAEASAGRLREGHAPNPDDEAKAELHERQAAEYDRKAADSTGNMRGYYRDKAREASITVAVSR